MGRESAGCSSSRPAQPRRARAGERRGASLQILCLLRYSAAHVSCVESHRSVPILPGKAGALQPPLLYCVLKVQVAPLCLLPRSAPAWLLLAPLRSSSQRKVNTEYYQTLHKTHQPNNQQHPLFKQTQHNCTVCPVPARNMMAKCDAVLQRGKLICHLATTL